MNHLDGHETLSTMVQSSTRTGHYAFLYVNLVAFADNNRFR